MVISDELMNGSFDSVQAEKHEFFLTQAKMFKLIILSDDATIIKHTFLIILASDVYSSLAVLNIVDFPNHMSGRMLKDAVYIADHYLPKMEKFISNKGITNMV